VEAERAYYIDGKPQRSYLISDDRTKGPQWAGLGAIREMRPRLGDPGHMSRVDILYQHIHFNVCQLFVLGDGLGVVIAHYSGCRRESRETCQFGHFLYHF